MNEPITEERLAAVEAALFDAPLEVVRKEAR